MVHKKNVSYVTVNAKAHNILCKDNARRVQQQEGKTKFYRT